MIKIHLFDAIAQMKTITTNGNTFSFSYRKYDRQRKKGGDLVHVTNAQLRPKPSDSDVEYASYKLFYMDKETNEPRQCWQILITEFNGKKIFL